MKRLPAGRPARREAGGPLPLHRERQLLRLPAHRGRRRLPLLCPVRLPACRPLPSPARRCLRASAGRLRSVPEPTPFQAPGRHPRRVVGRTSARLPPGWIHRPHKQPARCPRWTPVRHPHRRRGRIPCRLPVRRPRLNPNPGTGFPVPSPLPRSRDKKTWLAWKGNCAVRSMKQALAERPAGRETGRPLPLHRERQLLRRPAHRGQPRPPLRRPV